MNQNGNKKFSRNKWQWKHDNSKPMGYSKSILTGKFIAIQSCIKKQEKTSNRQSKFTPKTTGKKQTNKISRRKESSEQK